ncbi:hypothetical protein [Photorhabdus noenieputensis]|nr:hypothetical protein [Photorhabdus noenieputensis]MCK3670840.1 hypothetical protein [Photorhabdus noenieputensis]
MTNQIKYQLINFSVPAHDTYIRFTTTKFWYENNNVNNQSSDNDQG